MKSFLKIELQKNELKINKSHNARYYATKKLFSDAKKTMLDIERFERGDYLHRKKMMPGESKTQYKKRRRVEKREQLLLKFVPEKICSHCGEHRPNSKQWQAVYKTITKPDKQRLYKELYTFVCLTCVRKKYRTKYINKQYTNDDIKRETLKVLNQIKQLEQELSQCQLEKKS